MRTIVMAGLAALILTSPAAAQEKRGRSAGEAAEAFSLDLKDVPEDTAVTVPAEPGPAEPAQAKATTASAALFTLDTPIIRLVGDPRSRAVLDNDMPGLSDDANLVRFRDLSLRKFQPLTGGQLTDELLARVERDLAAIKPLPVGKGRNSAR